MDARCLHVSNVADLGKVAAGAFEKPEVAGRGQHLSIASALVSFGEITATLRAQGHDVSFRQVPAEVYANFPMGAPEHAGLEGSREREELAAIALRRHVITPRAAKDEAVGVLSRHGR